MFKQVTNGVAVTFVTAVVGVAMSGSAFAEPEPAPEPPPLPNVNAYTPVSPVDFTVNNGQWYAFAGPAGVTCIISRADGGYGCSGPLPGAPEGANVVSAGPVGPPRFSTTGSPIFAAAGQPRALAPNTRLSFREISCGVDGTGTVACVNSRDQVGFIVSPTTTVINDVMPLLERPEGTNPYTTGLPR